MEHPGSLATLSDAELFANVQRLTSHSNVTLAALLAHLGEVEARGLHRTRACASLYTYCIYELRMSEDAAYRRSKAARLVREYPELREIIAKGEIHLTGLLMIPPGACDAPHLRRGPVGPVPRAAFRSAAGRLDGRCRARSEHRRRREHERRRGGWRCWYPRWRSHERRRGE